MSLEGKELEDAECLIQTFTLPNMNTSDLAHFTENITEDLTLDDSTEMETPMETDENEVVLESQEDDMVNEEVVQTDLDTQEIEIESEDATLVSTSDQSIPDIKPTLVPALKPLTILPKPKPVSIAVKPTGGQQLLLLQGGAHGQAIKLVNQQGQELNLATLGGRPLNTVTLKAGVKTVTSGNFSLASQQKPVIMKKLITSAPRPATVGKPVMVSKPGQQIMVIQRPGNGQMKLVPASRNLSTLQNSAPKTITLQQAQEMGLISNNTRLVPTSQVTGGKQTVIINKLPQQKTIKILPQTSGQIISSSHPKTITLNQLKSPTKILPASALQGAKSGQRIIFKSATGGQTILPAGQLIQVSGAQSAGQIHQINIPGKGAQYIKFVTSTAGNTSGTPVSVNTVKSTSSLQPTLVPTSKMITKPITVKQIAVNKVTGAQQLFVVPSLQSGKVPIPAIRRSQPPPVQKSESSNSHSSVTESETNTEAPKSENTDANGAIRPRKPCNCTRSQCLKLYCDCFANGEFCYMCNCMNCSNNLENEVHRNRAIRNCLERNPNAFRPKIGKAKDTMGDILRKHTKGCNCKRSGCLKNYCECYEAKIACSSNCKCIGCRNIEDCMEKKLRLSMDSKSEGESSQRLLKRLLPAVSQELSPTRGRRGSSNRKQTINYITDDVIEATCQCLMTISDNADSNMQDDELTKRQIIEEFGRCLTEIISYSSNRTLS